LAENSLKRSRPGGARPSSNPDLIRGRPGSPPPVAPDRRGSRSAPEARSRCARPSSARANGGPARSRRPGAAAGWRPRSRRGVKGIARHVPAADQPVQRRIVYRPFPPGLAFWVQMGGAGSRRSVRPPHGLESGRVKPLAMTGCSRVAVAVREAGRPAAPLPVTRSGPPARRTTAAGCGADKRAENDRNRRGRAAGAGGSVSLMRCSLP